MQFLRVFSLAAVLFAFWLLLSGHFTPFLVGAGLVTAVCVAGLGLAIGAADNEGHPIQLLPRGLLYWPWLAKEIVKSAWDVTRIVLDPALPVAPRLVRVGTSQKTPTGVVIYANSITLTPGTISVEVSRENRELLVHALTSGGADGLATGDMDRRVAAIEGRR